MRLFQSGVSSRRNANTVGHLFGSGMKGKLDMMSVDHKETGKEEVDTGEWSYIKRNVEGVLERALQVCHSVVLVRGHRRDGKTTVVKSVLDDLQCQYELVMIQSDHDLFRQVLVEKLDEKQPSNLTLKEISNVFLDYIKQGRYLVLDEIQNASRSTQVFLQELLDLLAYRSLKNPKEWKSAGSVVIMGSMSDVMDEILEHHKVPLYQRIHAKVTVLPLDTFELCRMFKQLWGEANTLNGKIILTLFTLFGGRPYLYEKVCKAGLLKTHESITSDSLIEFLITKEYQGDGSDCYVRTSFSDKFRAALDIVEAQNDKDKQVDSLAKKINCNKDVAFLILQRLVKQYGLIEPVLMASDMQTIKRYRICDQAMIAAKTLSECVTDRSQDVNRHYNGVLARQRLETLEGQVFEDLIRRILNDRPLNRPILPHEAFKNSCGCKAYILPSISWGVEDVEIDILISLPNEPRLIIGSCKRSTVDGGKKKLLEHWNDFKKKIGNFKGILGKLMVSEKEFTEMTNVNFVHFVAADINRVVDDTIVINLRDLLNPFMTDLV